jgi:hypothetical protein
MTYNFFAHGTIACDFLSVSTTELLRAGFEGFVKVILVSGASLWVVGIHFDVCFGKIKSWNNCASFVMMRIGTKAERGFASSLYIPSVPSR